MTINIMLNIISGTFYPWFQSSEVWMNYRMLAAPMLLSNYSAFYGEHIYFSNSEFNGLFRAGLSGEELEYLGTFPYEPLAGDLHWESLMIGHRLYFAPFGGDNLDAYDLETGEFLTFEKGRFSGNCRYGGLREYRGGFFLLPVSGDKILWFNPETEKCEDWTGKLGFLDENGKEEAVNCSQGALIISDTMYLTVSGRSKLYIIDLKTLERKVVSIPSEQGFNQIVRYGDFLLMRGERYDELISYNMKTGETESRLEVIYADQSGVTCNSLGICGGRILLAPCFSRIKTRFLSFKDGAWNLEENEDLSEKNVPARFRKWSNPNTNWCTTSGTFHDGNYYTFSSRDGAYLSLNPSAHELKRRYFKIPDSCLLDEYRREVHLFTRVENLESVRWYLEAFRAEQGGKAFRLALSIGLCTLGEEKDHGISRLETLLEYLAEFPEAEVHYSLFPVDRSQWNRVSRKETDALLKLLSDLPYEEILDPDSFDLLLCDPCPEAYRFAEKSKSVLVL